MGSRTNLNQISITRPTHSSLLGWLGWEFISCLMCCSVSSLPLRLLSRFFPESVAGRSSNVVRWDHTQIPQESHAASATGTPLSSSGSRLFSEIASSCAYLRSSRRLSRSGRWVGPAALCRHMWVPWCSCSFPLSLQRSLFVFWPGSY